MNNNLQVHRQLVYLQVHSGKVKANSKIEVVGKGWVRAKDLLDSDTLLMYNGEQVKIDTVTLEFAEIAVATYNFEVEDFHTYFVGESSVLVHNFCAKTNAVEKLKLSNGKTGYLQKGGPFSGR